MRIVNLIEDTPGERSCLFEHGLSFYIETAKHRILLDTGRSDAFLKNADALGIDLAVVDTVVISHGHYDHAGGLAAFARINPTATVYIHKNATGAFYNLKNGGTKYIGMDPAIAALPQVTFVDGNLQIDDEIFLFSGVTGRVLWPRGNATLAKKTGEHFLQDPFDHEQYLVVSEGARRVLLSGCAHNGILNILHAYREFFGEAPTHVISGFHTTLSVYTEADEALILEMGRLLKKTDITFYSGHCTGTRPMEILSAVLGDRLHVLHSGDEIDCM